ncbi:MAG: hypothetical protein ACM3SW_07705 [Actinomycetota bacterium]
MADSSMSQPRISFAGLVCFWNIPGKPGESRRERFFSLRDDLQRNVEQRATRGGEETHPWALVRISEPGRRFWGFARRS